MADERMRELSRRGVRTRAERREAWVCEGWTSRRGAQRLLGLSRARVDDLRRDGTLVSERNPVTGAVRVRLSSVEAELERRGGAGT